MDLQAQAERDVELYVGKADISKVVSDCNAATDAILTAAEVDEKDTNEAAITAAVTTLEKYTITNPRRVNSYSKADIESSIKTVVNNGNITVETDVPDGGLSAAADGGAVVVTLTAGSDKTVVTGKVPVWVKTAP